MKPKRSASSRPATGEPTLAGFDSQQLLKAMLDNSFQFIQVFKAVRDASGQIIDFTWLLTNQRWQQTYGDVTGRSLLVQNPAVVQTGLFERMAEVTQTGISQTHEHGSSFEQGNDWFLQTLTRFGDGVMLTSLDISERKFTEEALRTSEQKYRRLFDSVDVGYCVIQLHQEAGQPLDFQFIVVNQAFERLTDLAAVEGQWMRQLRPFHEAYWFETYQQVALTGQPAEFEHLARELGQRWYKVHAFRLGGVHESQVAVLFEDITQRKHQEADLSLLAEVSQELAQLTQIEPAMQVLGAKIGQHFKASLCGFSIIDEVAGTFENPYVWHRSGVPSVVGVFRIDDYHAPELRRACRAGQPYVLRDVAAGSPQNARNMAALGVGSFVTVPLVRAGEWRFNLTLGDTELRDWQPEEIDLLRQLAERIWNRLERARAEEALREREERLRLFINASSDIVYQMSADWQQMQYLVGKDFLLDTHTINRSWFQQYIPPEDQASVQAVIQEAIRTKSPFELEHRVIQADGQRGWTFSRAIPLLDEQGEIREWFGAASNITARKQAERADRRKDEFLAMLSHELRNPLATLNNTLLLLGLTQGEDPTIPLEKAITIMRRELTHLNRMVDDLLDLSRIRQGKIQLKKQRIDLAQLVGNAVESFQTEFINRQQVLTTVLPPTPIWAEADATRLTQVVRNLLGNAAKYTPNGGHIQLKLEQQDAVAIMQVQDTGIGLAADQQERIFEVFEQVATSLDRPQGGLGLGLAVVRQLVEGHGGQVKVYSPGLGQGSVFTIRLPILTDTASLSPPVAKGETPGRRRLLVVDDNADLAMVTSMLLRQLRYQVDTRLSGPEALEAVEHLQPEAVLLDLGMPGMDGYETAHRLRQTSWGKQGVIVALTGYGQEQDKERSQAAGFDGHLVKPVDLATLHNVLARLLDKTQD